MRRTSYQKGSLRLADRKKGKVWEFLWREVQLDGAIRRKHIVIGTQEDLPTESAAQAAVDAIRLEINQQTPQRLIKSISFETLVNHYRQHEWTEKNPITSVRQSAKRQKAPDVLTPEEIMAFLKELPDPLRTMIELNAFTGLRRGELIGLRWQDVDFENLVLHIRRSVVAMVEGAPKTEASLKDVPLDAQTAESLWAWKHL